MTARSRLLVAGLVATIGLIALPGIPQASAPLGPRFVTQVEEAEGSNESAESAESADPVATAETSDEAPPVRRYGDRISVFSEPVHIPAGTIQLGDVVCIGADAVIEGEVRNVVMVGGSLRLSGRVRDQVVGVLSDLEFDGAEIGGQLVNVAGSLERHDSYVGGPSFNFSLGEWFGRMPSPFGVIGGLMFWGRLLKLFLAFVVVLLLASLVPERIRLIGDEAPVRYLAAVFVGCVAYLGAALLLLIAIFTVFGFPIALLLLRTLKWLGIAGIFHAVGRRMGRSMGREMSLLGGILLSFSLFSLISLFPYIGGIAGAGWWLVLPSQSLIFFGVWLFLEAPALGLVILTRAGTRGSDPIAGGGATAPPGPPAPIPSPDPPAID